MSGMIQRPTADQAAQQTGLPARVVVVLAHLDPVALGVALGSVAGAWVFVMTMTLVIRGGENVGANLSLLSQYFIGYSVTAPGAVIGLVYAALLAFAIGYAFALTRNLLVDSYLRYIRRRTEHEMLNDLLDRMT